MNTEGIGGWEFSHLWLDDIRNPHVQYLNGGGFPWIWVKTAEAAIDCLKQGRIEFASLDHDLGLPSCKACRKAAATPEAYAQVLELGCPHGEETGYHVVCWLEEHPEFWPINGVRVHSSNPAGRARMEQAIRKHYGRTW